MRIKLLPALIALGLATLAAHAAVTEKIIEVSAKTGNEILSWRLGTQGQRYSPLEQVNTSNFGKLLPA